MSVQTYNYDPTKTVSFLKHDKSDGVKHFCNDFRAILANCRLVPLYETDVHEFVWLALSATVKLRYQK